MSYRVGVRTDRTSGEALPPSMLSYLNPRRGNRLLEPKVPQERFGKKGVKVQVFKFMKALVMWARG